MVRLKALYCTLVWLRYRVSDKSFAFPLRGEENWDPISIFLLVFLNV